MPPTTESRAMSRRCPALAALLVALCASSAGAQVPPAPSPSPSEVAAARAQLDAGLAAARAGQWEAALESFSHAYQLAPRPLVLLDVASAQVHTGRLVAGAESYRTFLREVTSGAEAAHRATAEAALAALLPRIAHARVAVAGLASEDRLTLDGRALSSAALGVDLPLDPGPHVLAATRDGAPAARQPFTLRPGESRDVALALASDPVALAHVALPTPTPTRRVAPRPASVWTSPWLWTVVGVVVVGGAAAGGLALYESRPFAGTFSPGTVTVGPER